MKSPSLIVSFQNHMRASFGVAESVWKRVLDPVFRMVLVGGAILVFFLGYQAEKELQEGRIGLLLVQSFVSLAMIFIGANEIPRDVATRNVQFFMSKPLGRGGYIFGKYLGVLILGELLLGVYSWCFGLGMTLGNGFGGMELVLLYFRVSLQMVALSGLLIALSVFLPEMAATVFAVAFYLVAYVLFLIPSMLKLFFPIWIYPVFLVFYYPLPNWQHYLWTVEGIPAWRYFLLLVVYSAAYASFALFAADYWFRRRDLN